MRMRRKKVWLVQQAVWNLPTESMPLACGYLKAFVEADRALARDLDIRIFNFKSADNGMTMASRLFHEVPDILAFSVFGWNTAFGRIADAFKQCNPAGWVIFGGTHVANQAQRVFVQWPGVDIIANGEGEITFRELLHACVSGVSRRELSHIDGISFRDPAGGIVTTPERARIQHLDDIPSPVLTGAIELTGADGQFKYDVALLETNRGCPYTCAFCYWGGAIGQKVRRFSQQRLIDEIEVYGRLGVANVCLCDANFGMLPEDEEFLEILIRTREKHGSPRNLITSWAKNKGKRFYGMVRRMKQQGFQSSFSLALQTLSDEALRKMGRRNMKVNEWEDLADWLIAEGFYVHSELIWGCPGETYESFLRGYDKLAAKSTAIATYPFLMLPNTDYSAKRDLYRFVTMRGDADDFEYVLSHETMAPEDNRRAFRFLFWSRIIGEHVQFKYIWPPLNKLAGMRHSQVLLSLDAWFDAQHDPVSAGLRACRSLVADRFDIAAYEHGLKYLYSEPALDRIFEKWWAEEIVPRVPPHLADFFIELFRYDWASRPVYDMHAAATTSRSAGATLPIETVDGEDHYVRTVRVKYDIPAIVSGIAAGKVLAPPPEAAVRDVRLYFKQGFEAYINNAEFWHQYYGKPLARVRADRLARGAANAVSAPGEQPLEPIAVRRLASA